MDITFIYNILPLLIGCLLDRLFGDPSWLPHPIVGFGKIISWGEKKLNKGTRRFMKGAVFSIVLIVVSFVAMHYLLMLSTKINIWLNVLISSITVFYCLAGKTLIDEVKQVFIAVDSSIEEGRIQVARIVGRDTSTLNSQQVRKAALETLSENLSDGVIAPLFWFTILGVPGMLAYKMINTLDSMIGYKNERYIQFGCCAAHIDDIANYLPARLTAVLMILSNGKLSLFSFVKKYGNQHASPNSGYPESALAGILNCRFGGPNLYLGKLVDKPYIGDNDKELAYSDMQISVALNNKVETIMIVIVAISLVIINL